jgi:hypothetical protein
MSLLQALHLPSRPPARGQPPTPATPVALAIRKPDAQFEPNTRQSLSVVAFLSDGKAQSYTQQAVWSSSDEALVKMLPGGIAEVGFGSGPVTITAAAPGGKPRDVVSISVKAKPQDIVITPVNALVEVGETAVMTATAVYADGSREDVTPWLDWSTDTPKVVEFAQNGGAWVGKGPGPGRLAATDTRAKVTGFAKATVVDKGRGPKLLDIAIEPLNPEIEHGEDVQFRAYGRFDDKSTHEVTTKVKWRSSRPEVLPIDPDTGLATPTLQSGSASIGAVDDKANKGKSTTAYVDFPGIVRLEVLEKDVAIQQGEAGALTVMATLRGGGQKRVNEFLQFTVGDERIAKVPAGGALVNGLFPGKTPVEAYEPASQQSTTFDVTVRPPTLADIEVTPIGEVIPIGESRQFKARGVLEDGRRVELDRPLWRSSDRKILHVSQQGVVTARKRGEAMVIVRGRHSDVEGSIGVVAGL